MPQQERRNEMKKRTILRIVGIVVIFVALLVAVLAIILIALNIKSVGATLGTIPGIAWNTIKRFPIDWLISGAVGAALAFASCAIFWHWIKPKK